MSYLDHAATTPMLPEAITAMAEHQALPGNPSSLHASGRRTRRVVEESREALAASLGARPSELVFTSGGTEADNLALKGLFWSRRATDPAKNRLLVSPIEHHAVLDAAVWLAEHEGADLEWLPVDPLGRVHPDALREAVERNPDDLALISVMWANNEVGTVQPIRELAAVGREYGIPVHADAVQAFGQLPLSFADSGLDAMTVSAHKVGGPVGIGALLLSRSLTPVPLLHGGGQERDVRSGTLDAPAAAAFAVAGRHAAEHQPEFATRVGALRQELVAGVLKAVPDAVLAGDPGTDPGTDPSTDPQSRLPGNANLSFPGCEGDSLLLLLDARGIECSTGSACTAGIAQPSHVLLAMGAGPEAARSTLRFSLGHTSVRADITALVEAIGPVVERARSAGMVR